MWRNPRSAQTTVHCSECDDTMRIERTCHEVSMYCPTCDKQYPLSDYIAQADEAMETFLEGVYCDRM